MVLNTKRDILTRRIQQYESALADITMLQDRSHNPSSGEAHSLPRNLDEDFERAHNSHLADLIAFGEEISAELST